MHLDIDFIRALSPLRAIFEKNLPIKIFNGFVVNLKDI